MMMMAYKSKDMKDKIIMQYDEMLNNWNFPHKEFYLDTSYGKTFGIECGDKNAPPIILLHGSGMSSVMWLKDIKEYSQKYRVFAIDIPGDPGKSDERQWSLKSNDYSNWLNQVFNELSLEKAIIIGISLGAWFAIKFSIEHKEKVEKLILISPSGIGPQKISFIFVALFHAMLGEKGHDKLYLKISGNKSLPEAMMKYQKLISKGHNYRKGAIPIFSDDELMKLTMPVALFVGDSDIMLYSVKTTERLKKIKPDAEINILINTGHAITDIVKNITRFLVNER